MSENTFPFDDEAPPLQDGLTDAEADPGSRKALLAVGGVAAALLLAGGAYLVLGGGSADEQASGPVSPGVRRAAPLASTSTAPRPTSAKKLPAAFKEPLGRDPFRALYLAPAAAEGGAGTAGPAGTAGTGTLGTAGTVGTPGAGPVPTVASSPGANAGGPQVVIVAPPSLSPTVLPTLSPTLSPTSGPSSSPTSSRTPSTGASPTASASPPASAPATTPANKEYTLVFKGIDTSGGKKYGVFTIDGKAVRVVAPSDSEKPTLFGPTLELGLAELQDDRHGHVLAAIRIGESGFDLAMGQKAYVR